VAAAPGQQNRGTDKTKGGKSNRDGVAARKRRGKVGTARVMSPLCSRTCRRAYVRGFKYTGKTGAKSKSQKAHFVRGSRTAAILSRSEVLP
jgi:hypothetical protein